MYQIINYQKRNWTERCILQNIFLYKIFTKRRNNSKTNLWKVSNEKQMERIRSYHIRRHFIRKISISYRVLRSLRKFTIWIDRLMKNQYCVVTRAYNWIISFFSITQSLLPSSNFRSEASLTWRRLVEFKNQRRRSWSTLKRKLQSSWCLIQECSKSQRSLVYSHHHLTNSLKKWALPVDEKG